MENKRLQATDRELIIALTVDFLNVYCVYPAIDRVDVIKLDGYVTEGIGDKWSEIRHSTLLNTYVHSRVHPDDQERLLKEIGNERLLTALMHRRDIQGKYRVVEADGSVHYYAYKYVRVSSVGDPFKVVAAFRNVDAIEAEDQQKMAELERLRNTLQSTGMGVWELVVSPGKDSELYVDDKMMELMGVTPDMHLTPAETCKWLIDRIHPGDLDSFKQYDTRLQGGQRAECTYRWIHPTIGERYVRCGGSAGVVKGDVFYASGYHYDVTDQIAKELRTSLIIKAYARQYYYINYVNFDDGTFVTYTESDNVSDNLLEMLISGNIKTALVFGIRELVCEEHKDMMSQFCDLSTMNERLRTSNIIFAQFKNYRDEWEECSFAVAERHADGSIKNLLWAVREIDDEKQIEIRRQKALEDNIAANKTKTKFLHNMSHEIRTPLNALFGFAQLLGLPDGTWTPEEKEEYNTYIYNSYGMLDMLIRDIMDVADSEHTDYQISITNVNVNTICRNTLMTVEGRKPIDVNMYFTSELPDDYIVSSDGRRIQQVLTNYLTNACKNTTQGEIHLHCSQTENPGRLTFSVTDTGIGVPPDKADEIFKRFVKLNEYVQGAGLGLNICQMIASKLGGEVYLDKSYIGGARFVFTIDDKRMG